MDGWLFQLIIDLMDDVLCACVCEKVWFSWENKKNPSQTQIKGGPKTLHKGLLKYLFHSIRHGMPNVLYPIIYYVYPLIGCTCLTTIF